MARRRVAAKRPVLADPKFGSEMLTRFVNVVMKSGKKAVAERIVYGALDRVGEKTKGDAFQVLSQALDNIKPIVEVKSRRVGGATYQVPTEVRPDRRTALAIRWLIMYSEGRGEKSFPEKLAAELLAAANNEGASIKKKEDTHKMAEANKAFAHFKW